MSLEKESKGREEVKAFIGEINEAWVKGRPGDLKDYFHEEMVIFSPGFGVRGEGREACVKSYEDFVSQATVDELVEIDMVVDLWGGTAVATYRFEVSYKMNGQKYRDTGRDLFVLIREDGRWWAVWRTMIMSPLVAQG